MTKPLPKNKNKDRHRDDKPFASQFKKSQGKLMKRRFKKNQRGEKTCHRMTAVNAPTPKKNRIQKYGK